MASVHIFIYDDSGGDTVIESVFSPPLAKGGKGNFTQELGLGLIKGVKALAKEYAKEKTKKRAPKGSNR